MYKHAAKLANTARKNGQEIETKSTKIASKNGENVT